MNGRSYYDIDAQAVDDYAVWVVDNAVFRAISGNSGETAFEPQGCLGTLISDSIFRRA